MNVLRRALVPLILVSLVAMLLGCKDIVRERIAALNLNIQKELPPHSTYSDVLAYLDKNRIEHTTYERANSAEELRLLESPGRVDGIVRRVKVGLISTSDIRLMFLFDDRGRMISYKIVESVKAP